MGVFRYADDLSLLCPSFTGIKEMLNICEKYARKYDILFNATKSQLLYFGKDSNNDNVQPVLSMDNGKKIPYVTKCLHLGNSISTTGTQRSLINNAIAGLNIKSIIYWQNFYLAIILLYLYYSSPTVWIFMAVRCGDTIIIQILTIFVFHGGKLLDDYGRHPIELIIV